MRAYYYWLCEDCEYLYHCFGREVGERIENGEVDDLDLAPGSCRHYYPEVKG